jgi:hypothetical protein
VPPPSIVAMYNAQSRLCPLILPECQVPVVNYNLCYKKVVLFYMLSSAGSWGTALTSISIACTAYHAIYLALH